jgi:hypothetical protein
MRALGNARVNDVLEFQTSHAEFRKPTKDDSMEVRKVFIVAKYQEKKFVNSLGVDSQFEVCSGCVVCVGVIAFVVLCVCVCVLCFFCFLFCFLPLLPVSVHCLVSFLLLLLTMHIFCSSYPRSTCCLLAMRTTSPICWT